MKFTIPNMNCGACAKSIAQAIKTIDPDAVTIADLPNHVLTVESVAGEAEIRSVLIEAGFPSV